MPLKSELKATTLALFPFLTSNNVKDVLPPLFLQFKFTRAVLEDKSNSVKAQLRTFKVSNAVFVE